MSFRQLAPARGCVTPALSHSLESLDVALRRENWEESCSHLRDSLRHLLIFFTSAVAGLVQELEHSRPEIQALAESVDSTASYERLLRFSLSVLRTLDHPMRNLLLPVFVPPDSGQKPPIQGRWLLGGGAAPDLPPLLSMCDEALRPLQQETEANTVADEETRLEQYLPILNNWLLDARAFMEEFRLELEETHLGRKISGLSSSRFRFSCLPRIDWLVVLPLAFQSGDATLPGKRSISLDPPELEGPFLQFPQTPNGDSLAPRREASPLSELEKQFTQPLRWRQCPQEIVLRLHTFCQERRSGYILLEGPAGAGKSLVVSSLGLAHEGAAGAPYPIVVLPVREALQSDYQTFIEILDERLKDSVHSQLRPLGHRVTRELNERYPAHLCSKRFFAYLSGLLLLSGSRILLVLDGLDEVFEGSESQIFLSDFLPEALPDGAFIVITSQRDACASRTVNKLEALEAAGAVRYSLDPADKSYQKYPPRFLGADPPPGSDGQVLSLIEHRHVLAESELLSASLVRSSAELFPLAFEALERKLGNEPLELLLALASIPGRLRVADMNLLGLPASTLQALLENWHSLLRLTLSDYGLTVALAHQELRQFLLENYAQAYASCCRRLAQRASHFLSQEIDVLDLTAVDLEPQRRMLGHLHTWLLDSQDVDLIGQVFSSTALRRLRQSLCNQLEAQGRFHHKLSILAGYREGLSLLTERHSEDELYEELAWAHSSRGLTYLRLGQFARCLGEIDKAIKIFRYLIEERGCEAYRGGLASALNRQSEALLHLGEVTRALTASDMAVEGYRTVVEERGQSEQSHLLARSLTHRARCQVLLGRPDLAAGDFDRAISLYDRHTRPGDSRVLQAHTESLLARAEQNLFQGSLERASADLTRARQQLEQIGARPSDRAVSGLYIDFDGRVMMVRTLELQAQVHRTQGLHQDALQFCDDALSILHEMLDGGRLDVRERSAQILSLRGQLWAALGEADKAGSDWTHALAHLGRLIEFEGHPGLRPIRAQIYLLRASYLQDSERENEALQDYERAIEDLAPAQVEAVASLPRRTLFELSQAQLNLGLLLQKTGDENGASERFAYAIRCLQHEPAWLTELARAYRLKSQSYRRQGRLELALDDIRTCIDKLSHILENHPELRTDLALAHHLRGELQELQGEKKEALRDFTLGIHLLTMSPYESASALIKLSLARAHVYFELGQADSALADTDEALALLENGNGEEASQVADMLAAYNLKSRIYLGRGEAEAALCAQDKALEIMPAGGAGQTFREAYWLRRDRCLTLISLGRYLEAADELLCMMDEPHVHSGRSSQESLFRELCQLLRSESNAILQKPGGGDSRQALELLQKELELRLSVGLSGETNGSAVEARVSLVEVFNLNGWLLAELNHMAEALESYEQTCSLTEPVALEEIERSTQETLWGHRVWAFKQRGLLLESMHQTEAALVIYDQTLDWLENSHSDRQENFAWVLMRQALLFARQNRMNEALAALSRSIKIDVKLNEEAAQESTQPVRTRLAQAFLLRARWRETEAGSDSPEALEDLSQALPLLIEQEGKTESLEQDLLYCRWKLLSHSPSSQLLGPLLDKLESCQDLGQTLWPSGPNVARLLISSLLALPNLASSDGSEMARLIRLVKSREPEQLADFPATPELFLKLRVSGKPQSNLELTALASRQSWLETRAHGGPAYPRLLFCLHQLALQLAKTDSATLASVDFSAGHWQHVTRAMELILHYLDNCNAQPVWQVELNNLAKSWQALPAPLTDRIKVRRSLLQSLRRW